MSAPFMIYANSMKVLVIFRLHFCLHKFTQNCQVLISCFKAWFKVSFYKLVHSLSISKWSLFKQFMEQELKEENKLKQLWNLALKISCSGIPNAPPSWKILSSTFGQSCHHNSVRCSQASLWHSLPLFVIQATSQEQQGQHHTGSFTFPLDSLNMPQPSLACMARDNPLTSWNLTMAMQWPITFNTMH